MQRLREEFKVDIAETTLNRWFYREGLVKKCLSLEERMEIAKIVKELRQQGLGHRKIGLHASCYYNKKNKLWRVITVSKMLYELLKTGKWRVMVIDDEAAKVFLRWILRRRWSSVDA